MSKHHRSLLDHSHTYGTTKQLCGLPHPGGNTRLCPLLNNSHAETKKYGQMKDQIKAPEKIQLGDKEIANLSDP